MSSSKRKRKRAEKEQLLRLLERAIESAEKIIRDKNGEGVEPFEQFHSKGIELFVEISGEHGGIF